MNTKKAIEWEEKWREIEVERVSTLLLTLRRLLSIAQFFFACLFIHFDEFIKEEVYLTLLTNSCQLLLFLKKKKKKKWRMIGGRGVENNWAKEVCEACVYSGQFGLYSYYSTRMLMVHFNKATSMLYTHSLQIWHILDATMVFITGDEQQFRIIFAHRCLSIRRYHFFSFLLFLFVCFIHLNWY